ncbi:glycosyltransferase [Bacillus spongiae]|uniref:Glycosyltransferase n=1 Tax=Bacillus spongiae TaxID=2683610 RepID=A0ABU8HED8_9BACI
MKKKIVFMVIDMNIGGTEKALLNMISEMPQEKFDITIYMLEKRGGFLQSIPDYVHIKYLTDYAKVKSQLTLPPFQIVEQLVRKGRWMKGIHFAFIYLLSKLVNDRGLLYKYILKEYPKDTTEYDIAVAYAGPMDFISFFVLTKLTAKKRIQWIHFDVNKIGFNKKLAAKLYQNFDKIFVVSDEGKEKLSNVIPNVRHNIDSFSNIVSSELVRELSDKGSGFVDDFDGIRILTVGRLSKEKGQDLIIHVLAKLKELEYNVRWYCIGEGSARKEYEQLARELNVEDDFILLGSSANPYPYMKYCDLYVQPSRHEGYCITLAEARCFHKPIITTNFTGANEQITHNETGLIVEFDESQLLNAIRMILDRQELQKTFKRNLMKEHIDTSNELDKIYKFANES